MRKSYYSSLRFVLRTKKGYLTYNGVVEEPTDPDIIVLNLYNLGGINFKEKKTIERFLNQSEASCSAEGCSVLGFICPRDGDYNNCFNCPDTEICSNNRKKSDFFKTKGNPLLPFYKKEVQVKV